MSAQGTNRDDQGQSHGHSQSKGTGCEARYRRHEHIVTREILGETLLVPISADVADMSNIFALNETGALVWQQLDGEHTLADVCGSVVEEFDVAPEQARLDVAALIAELESAGLIDKVE